MKIIGFNNIRSLNISPVDCYNWATEMISHKESTVLPPKIHLAMPDNEFCNVMPSLIDCGNGNHRGGIKVVTRYPLRIPSLDSKILLFDSDSGEFLALLDGNWITAMRTGAVAAHSVLTFAKNDFKTIGIIGLGNVARSTLLCLAEKIKTPKRILLFDYKDQARLFMDRFKEYSQLDFSVSTEMKEFITSSDVIISCATYFENDIAEGEWFREGILVIPVHTRGFTNCDLFFDKIFADDTGHVDHFSNFAKFRYFAEVSDVINGNSKGRENDMERILVYNIGVSIHDINFASHIYSLFASNADAFSKLETANLQDPVDKFWV